MMERSSTTGRFSIWLARHAGTSIAAFGRIVRHPFSTFMIVLVIGVTLALPASWESRVELDTASGDIHSDFRMTVEEMREHIGADSLAFLSLDGMMQAVASRDSGDDDGGCGCAAPGDHAPAGGLAMLGIVGLLLRRRRRRQ